MTDKEVIELMKKVEEKRPDEFTRVIGIMQGILIAGGKKNEVNRCS